MSDLECHKIPNDSENETDMLLYKTFIGPFRSGYLELGPKKYALPEAYLRFKEEIDNFEVLPEDILIMTHPKTGTTWVHELVWLLKNDFDYNKAAETTPMDRVPFLDVSILFDVKDLDLNDPENADLSKFEHLVNSIERASKYEHPRLVKTHLPWELLPKAIRNASEEELNDSNGFKIIYVHRNAKDVCISYYHHCVRYEGFTGSLNDFVKLFIGGRISYGPYFKHIESCYKRRHFKNVLMLNYEDMKKDLKAVIRQVADFIGKSVSELEVDKLFDFLQFENMKNLRKGDEFQYEFYRSGTVGSYKKEMSEDMLSNLNEWVEKEMEDTKMDLPNLLVT